MTNENEDSEAEDARRWGDRVRRDLKARGKLKDERRNVITGSAPPGSQKPPQR